MDFSFAFLLKWKIKSKLSLLLLFSPPFKTIPSSNKALKYHITSRLGPITVGQGRRRNKVQERKLPLVPSSMQPIHPTKLFIGF